MALIECSECGRSVSDKAPTCIHCGIPMALASTDVSARPLGARPEVAPVTEGPKAEDNSGQPSVDHTGEFKQLIIDSVYRLKKVAEAAISDVESPVVGSTSDESGGLLGLTPGFLKQAARGPAGCLALILGVILAVTAWRILVPMGVAGTGAVLWWKTDQAAAMSPVLRWTVVATILFVGLVGVTMLQA